MTGSAGRAPLRVLVVDDESLARARMRIDPVIAEEAHSLGQFRVIRRNHAPLSRSHIFCCIKGETTG